MYQVLFSAADQLVFGETGNYYNNSSSDVYYEALALLGNWQKKNTIIPSVQDHFGNDLVAMNLLNHSHFVTYGGEYYSYIFAKRTADAIWNKHFCGNRLNREKGLLLWNAMLAPGSSRKPEDVLSELL